MATIKHTPHGHALQPAGTDTAAHLSAQPAAVALSPRGAWRRSDPGRRTPRPSSPGLLRRGLVLVEGRRSAPGRRCGSGAPSSPRTGTATPTRVLAVAGAPAAPGCPQIPATGPAMADPVEALVRCLRRVGDPGLPPSADAGGTKSPVGVARRPHRGHRPPRRSRPSPRCRRPRRCHRRRGPCSRRHWSLRVVDGRVVHLVVRLLGVSCSPAARASRAWGGRGGGEGRGAWTGSRAPRVARRRGARSALRFGWGVLVQVRREVHHPGPRLGGGLLTQMPLSTPSSERASLPCRWLTSGSAAALRRPVVETPTAADSSAGTAVFQGVREARPHR